MGTALAKRSIWTVIAENPFPFFDAEGFRAEAVDRLEAYAGRVGGQVVELPPDGDSAEIFRVHLEDLPFPHGPGRGCVEVSAYRAFGQLHVSLVVEHDRLFRSLDGRPGSRLFLHDYKFVRAYGPDRPPSPDEIDEALTGVERARTAVERRNEAAGSSRSPFARIRIALRASGEDHFPPVGLDLVGDDESAPVTHRRAVVIKALREDRPGPVKIRIRRRKDDPEEPTDD
jgi:hypothetical protein